MKTIDELEKYLEDECYSFVELTVGKHFAPEGIFIEKDGGRYNFGYSERGNKIILKSFQTEEDLFLKEMIFPTTAQGNAFTAYLFLAGTYKNWKNLRKNILKFKNHKI